jgi:eukaryotic-like serine/threonine-protein kinase
VRGGAGIFYDRIAGQITMDTLANPPAVLNPTRPGMIVGTVAYMSPEQASGRPVDGRSDIFSFGVVLYELLAGRRPFAGKTHLEVLQTIIHGAPPRLGEDVPASLRAVVEKALEKDPGDRYQPMREMVVDLRRLTRQSAETTAPSPPQRRVH